MFAARSSRLIAGLPRTATWIAAAGGFGLGFGQRSIADGLVLALGLTLAGAFVLLAVRPTPRVQRGVLLLTIATTMFVSARPLYRYVKDAEQREWSVFHYYLGGKYFPELGYDGLYDQALAADRERERRWAGIAYIRNAETLEIEPATYEQRQRREAWTDERWREFGDTIVKMQPTLRDDQWALLLTDRGYNGTPPYTAVLRVITLLPWSEPARYALVGVDIVLLLAALLGVGRRFGALTAWAVAAWTQLFYGMWKHSIGGLFQLDHLAALFGGLTAVASGRPALSGVLFAWACMSRIFPAFLVLGLVPWALASRHRDGRWPTMLRPFLLAFSLTCLLCLGLGTATGRGPSAWVDFVADMEAHTELHPFGKRRLGLEHIFTAGIGEELEDIGRDRKENLAAQRPIWAGLAAVLVAFWAWAGTRLRSDDPLHAMVAGLLPCFALIVLSRYYGAAYAAVALLALPTPRRAPTLLWAAMVATSVIPHWIDRALDKPFEGYVLGNLLFGAAFVSLAAFRLRREEAVTPAPTADPA